MIAVVDLTRSGKLDLEGTCIGGGGGGLGRPGFTLGHLAQRPPAFRLIGGAPRPQAREPRESQFDEILCLRQLKPLKILPLAVKTVKKFASGG